MSSQIARTLTITYSNCQSMLTAGTGMTLHVKASGYYEMYMSTKNTSDVYATLTSSAKNVLYPNDIAKPTKGSARITLSRQTGLRLDTAYGSLQFNGSSVLSGSGSTGSPTNATISDSTDTAITNSTKNSTIRYALRSLYGDLTAYCGGTDHDSTYITLYFDRYDFVASADTGITSAAVSSSTGYDGDTITYSCVVSSGYNFDGWYDGATLVSTSQTYTHTVNGADFTLTAKATVSSKTCTVTYNGSTISTETVYSDVSLTYNGSTLATFFSGSKTLKCNGKVMASNVVIGGKTLQCNGKLMASDISASIS